MSNTKICATSKMFLETFKKNNPQVKFFNNGIDATVLEKQEFPGSKMKLISVSFASVDEIKFRRKVGEYKAMEKFENGEFIKVPVDFFPIFCV